MTADYIRENDLSGMMDGIHGVVRRYPTQALAVALVAGFFVGKAFSSSRV